MESNHSQNSHFLQKVLQIDTGVVLLQVLLQTEQGSKKSISSLAVTVVRENGVRGLYNGISASLFRQLTYSTTRFALYDILKRNFTGDSSKPSLFYEKVAFAGISGGCGGIMGTPMDMVNVRMQNDMKTEKRLRRNYKNVVDGLIRVYRAEGIKGLFTGGPLASMRAAILTIGQLSMYDQFKQMLIHSGWFDDNIITHFTASSLAGAVATTMIQPMDVMKTRMMNAKPDQFNGIVDCFIFTAKSGPLSFFIGAVATTMIQPMDVMKTRMMNAKPAQFNGIVDCFIFTAKSGPLSFFIGYIPALVRLAPQTILTFIFLEQLRLNFGYFPMHL